MELKQIAGNDLIFFSFLNKSSTFAESLTE